MDAKKSSLEKKLQDLLKQVSTVATQIQAIAQGDQTPHFDQIELPAHDLGKQFSRMVQSERARELAATNLNDATRTCGRKRQMATSTRKVNSMDSPVELTETVAKCRSCRRSFFPSAYQNGT